MSHPVERILTGKLKIIQKTLVILIYIFGNDFLWFSTEHDKHNGSFPAGGERDVPLFLTAQDSRWKV